MSNFKTTCLFLLIIFLSLNSFEQTITKNINAGDLELQASAVDSAINFLFCSIGEMPEYPGGYDSLASFVHRHIKYPKSAVQDSVEGRVEIQFTVDTNGRVINSKIFKSVRTDLDTLCLSTVKQMPTWAKVGRLEGKAVAVQFILPIKFILRDKKKK